MTLLSLTAYAETHGVTKQSAAEWKGRGYLVMEGALVNAEASDEKMRSFGKGRFRCKAHGGRREKGVRGVPDRPGLAPEASKATAAPVPYPWVGWTPLDNPNTMAGHLRAWGESGDPDDLNDAVDLAEFAQWDEVCMAAGWDRWPSDVARGLASEFGMADREDALRDALQRHVRARLIALGFTDADLADDRLRPR